METDPLNSDATVIPTSAGPGSNAQQLSAPDPTSEADEIRAIWGTNVNRAQTMRYFREFLRGFKPKYRIAHDRAVGNSTRALARPEDGDELLYETYLRRMRQTEQTNLNVDVINILSYGPSKKLHSQLLKYPQEVIPAMDQVLKDVMLELAEQDRAAGMEDMVGEEGEEIIGDIMGKVYKIRPFGEKPGNMRELDPTGTSCASTASTSKLI
jgi:DNA replication licensing factor MCM4